MLRMIGLALVALTVGGSVAWAASSRSHATIENTVSNVATGKADAVELADFDCTESDAFADMPGVTKKFAQGGRMTQPAVAFFQGQWEGNGGARIRLTIDGSPQSLLVPVYRSGFGTNGFQFITGPLTPGPHTAKIQWSSEPAVDGAVCVLSRSLIVLHK